MKNRMRKKTEGDIRVNYYPEGNVGWGPKKVIEELTAQHRERMEFLNQIDFLLNLILHLEEMDRIAKDLLKNWREKEKNEKQADIGNAG